MPKDIGHGELKVVASRDIGELGDKDSQPVAVDWQWRHELTGGGWLWLLVPLLIAGVVFNRPAGARPVAVVLLAILLVWQFC